MLHGHGDDAYRHGVPVRANFSSNVRPSTRLAALREQVLRHFDLVAAYPEAAAESLARRIAAVSGLSPDQVVPTAGATAAIYLIAHAHRRSRSAIVTPTFAEYADACTLQDHTIIRLRREALAAGQLEGVDLVWLCNPNNPTGEVFSRAQLLDLADAHPATRFVIDLAYAAQCETPPLRPADLVEHPNLLLVRSLSKDAGIPGVRLGYLCASRAEANTLRRHCQPWAVSALAAKLGEFVIGAPEEPADSLRGYLAEARRLREALARVPGCRPWDSATGFFVLELGRGTARELKEALLRDHGLLVRDASNFAGLDERHVRISSQLPEQNRWLEEALHAWSRT